MNLGVQRRRTLSDRYFSPAETARRLGVSVRALRFYERRGLVRPHRTEAGWRVYGPAEIERLHRVLALKSFGLSLARIAELIGGKAIKLDTLLAAQEAALVERRTGIEQALGALRAARTRLEEGQALSLDDLIRLTRETNMTVWPSSDEWAEHLEPVFRRHLSDEQYEEMFSGVGARLHALGLDEAGFNAAWRDLTERATRLMRANESEGDEAKAVVARWGELGNVFIKGDLQLNASAASALFEALSDPGARRDLPFSPELFAFMVKLAAKQPRDPPAATDETQRYSAAAVRRLIDAWRKGACEEAGATPEASAEMARILPMLQQMVTALGDLGDIAFLRRDGEADVFALSFSEAQMISAVQLDGDGRIAMASLGSGWLKSE